MNFSDITDLILKRSGKIIIGIDGKDASGKTMLADKLADFLKNQTKREVIRVSLDDFFNPREIRRQNPDEARGCYEDTFNLEDIVIKLLKPFRESGSYVTKTFDYAKNEPTYDTPRQASEDAILIIDGVFLQRAELRDFWDMTILLEVDDEVAIERGAQRDIQRIGDLGTARQRYIQRYIASQRIYYDECDPLKEATIIIDNTDFSKPKRIK